MDVVKLFKQGNQKAFEEIYRQYYKKVYLFARKHTSDSTLAEDILHDAFLRLWEKRSLINPDAPIEAQLFVITRNLIINQYRREISRQQVHEQLTATEKEADADDELSQNIVQQIHAAIEALPPKRRQIFKLLFEQLINTKSNIIQTDIPIRIREQINEQLIDY